MHVDPTSDGEGQEHHRVLSGELRDRLAALEAGLKELSAVEVSGCSAEELGETAVAVHRLLAASNPRHPRRAGRARAVARGVGQAALLHRLRPARGRVVQAG